MVQEPMTCRSVRTDAGGSNPAGGDSGAHDDTHARRLRYVRRIERQWWSWTEMPLSAEVWDVLRFGQVSEQHRQIDRQSAGRFQRRGRRRWSLGLLRCAGGEQEREKERAVMAHGWGSTGLDADERGRQLNDASSYINWQSKHARAANY